MVKWKKMNKKMAGLLLGVMMLFTASTTAFAYVDEMIRQHAFEHLRGMIYFTDGRGIYPAKTPVYETAFVFMEEEYEDVDVPPWAIKIILEEGQDFKGNVEIHGGKKINGYKASIERNQRFHRGISCQR